MVSTTTDRLSGVNGGVATKKPVRVATTANITLSGEQTIDGVLTSSSDVLVKDQSTSSQNGIYTTSSGAWTRREDADGVRDLVRGSLVFVNDGTVNSGTYWSLEASSDPIVPGTTSITFENFVNIVTADLLEVTQTTPALGDIVFYNGAQWVNFNYPAANLAFSGNNSFSGNSTFNNDVFFPVGATLTIASGVVTSTRTFHLIANEGGASADNLDTITAGTDGQLLILSPSDATDVTTLTESGNIVIPKRTIYNLSGTDSYIILKYSSTLSKWVLVSTPQVFPATAYGTVATTQATTSTSYVDVTSLTANLPSLNSTASKVLVHLSMIAGQNGLDGSSSAFRIMRDIDGGGYSSITGDLPLMIDHDQGNDERPCSYVYYDEPASTGSITYKVQVKVSSASSTLSVNGTANYKSFIIAQEIL